MIQANHVLSSTKFLIAVIEIMAYVAETGDWKTALERSIPKRRAYFVHTQPHQDAHKDHSGTDEQSLS